MWKVIYQEQRVGQVAVEENGPANPATVAVASIHKLGHDQSHYNADKLVARVCHQVKELRLARNIQEIGPELQEHKLKYYNDASF